MELTLESPNQVKQQPKIVKYINKFFYSYLYLGLLLVLNIVSYQTKIVEIAFVSSMILFAISLIFVDDLTPLIPGIFMLPFCLPIGIQPENYYYLVYYLIIAIVPLIYHMIKFKPNKTWGKYSLSQLIVSIALIIGGIGSNITAEQYSKGLVQALTLGILTLVLYLLVRNYCKTEDYDFMIYFAKSMTLIGIGLLVEQIIWQFFNPSGSFLEINLHNVQTGTYCSTNIGMLYLLTAPFAFYLGLKQQKVSIIYYALGFLQFIATFLTISRGAIFSMFLTFPLCIIYVIVKDKEHRKKTIIEFAILIAVLLITYLCCLDEANLVIQKFIDRCNKGDINSFSTNRITLYKEGFKVFCEYPLFGAGLGYMSKNLVVAPIVFFHFHSTFVQVIANMGIFGLICYLYQYIVRFKITFKGRKNPFNMIVFFAFLGFELYSMTDCGVFIPMPFMFLVTIMTAFLEFANLEEK